MTDEIVDTDSVAALETRIRQAGFVVTACGEVSSLTAAAVLGVSAGTLRNWRSSNRGPAYRRRHRRVWYPTRALHDFLDS
jgi:hypothetical protein